MTTCTELEPQSTHRAARSGFCLHDSLRSVIGEDVQKIVEKGTTQPEPVIGSGEFFLPEISFYTPTAISARLRFGYQEYSTGSGDALFCNPSRLEECSTSATNGDAYAFLSEHPTWQTCAANSQCTITLPGVSGRVLSYRLDRSTNNGASYTSGPTQITTVN